LRISAASPAQFVKFWSDRYNDQKYDENVYLQLIQNPPTPELVRALFKWKNGTPLSAKKRISVETNYVSRLDEILRLPETTSADDFLRIFTGGGAVWRIFWLHCWKPDRFPIYDQHVHRAMTYILTGRAEEPPLTDKRKIRVYIEQYFPFTSHFSDLPARQVDRALWTFGKYIKERKPACVEPLSD